VFVDFENLALGFKNRSDRFEIDRVLQRLVEKGKIIVKKGYADWSRFADYKRTLHEAGLELIEIPRRAMTGKNSADIHLVVDAMDLSYAKDHIDTFVIVSGDSDFSPLVSKLKENGKQVIGLGMRSSTSELLVSSCDEFIFYEDLADLPKGVELGDVPAERREVFVLLLETLSALQREVAGKAYASMVKDTMRRKQPSFLESSYGYRNFSDLLEEARSLGLIELSKDDRSGTYVVTSFKASPQKRTRRGGRRRSSQSTIAAAEGTPSERQVGAGDPSRRTTRTTKVDHGSDSVARTEAPRPARDSKEPDQGTVVTVRRRKSSPRKKSGRKASTTATHGPTHPRPIDSVVTQGPRRSGPSRRRSRSRLRLPQEPKQ
jgi:uncharacterized protein (TIGR00288 family)